MNIEKSTCRSSFTRFDNYCPEAKTSAKTTTTTLGSMRLARSFSSGNHRSAGDIFSNAKSIV